MLVNGAKRSGNSPFWLIFLAVPFNKIPLFSMSFVSLLASNIPEPVITECPLKYF